MMEQNQLDTRRSDIWVALALTLVFAFLVAIIVVPSESFWLGDASLDADSLPMVALSVIFVGLTLLPFWLSRKNGKFNWFEIICIISAGYLLTFGLRGLYVVWTGARIGFMQYEDTLVQAQLVALLGFVCLLIGYYLPWSRKVAALVPAPAWRWSLSPGRGKVVLLYAIGLGARILGDTFDVGVTFQYYGIWLSNLTAYAMAIAFIYAFVDPVNKRRWGTLLVFMLPIQLLFAFVGDPNKRALLEPIFVIAICYHYFYKPISLRVVLAVGLVIVLTVFPLISRFRNLAFEPDLVTRLTRSVGDFASGQIPVVDYAVASVMDRSHLVDSVALVLKYATVPDLISGITPYLLIPAYAFVPRVIWEDKPIDSAILFGRQFFGLTGDTSIGISNPGDLYLNLGFIGIVLGMFVLGIFYRVLYTTLITRWRGSALEWRLPFFFIYLFVVQQLYLAFEGSLYVSLSELLKILVLLGLVVLFMRAPAPRVTASEPT